VPPYNGVVAIVDAVVEVTVVVVGIVVVRVVAV
jgi:hypothetical protein